ncbi:MAG: DUF2959 family protein [Phycisphaerae bacterium]
MQKLILLPLLVLLVGCNKAYYSTLEAFGVEKRDVLVDKVGEAKAAQTAAAEQFQTTFERFQEVSGFQGGDLEAKYDKLEDELNAAKRRAARVTDRIDTVAGVADDLFEEWEDELDEYDSAELRRTSQEQLRTTRGDFNDLLRTMRAAEARMDPVLRKFNDYVLALKHNLNARAIGSLSGVAAEIDGEVAALIADMQKSVAEAEAFLEQMGG